MSLLVLMYHRAQAGEYGNSAEMLDRHFAHIAAHYRCLLPGQPLEAGHLNLCLTFDDGYFDFYAIVYPLLQKHHLTALLAVPPAVVAEHSASPFATRLTAPVDFVQPNRNGEAFCTWKELREMAESGRVEIAAHGFNHRRLDTSESDLHAEIVVPQTTLAARLGRPVNSFVFPYGRFSPAALRQVRQSYRHVFRIGGADNSGWGDRLLYRVSADNLASPEAPFAPSRLALYRVRRLWNLMRGR